MPFDGTLALMNRKLLLFSLLIFLLAACTRPASDSPATPLPLNFPSPAPGSTPLCQPADLDVSSNSIGATGALMLGITLTNKSKNPCTLSNPPQVTLLDNSNKPLDIQISSAPADQTPPAPTQAQIAGGESVILSLVWHNYCQTLPQDSLTVRLALSTGQNLDVAMKLLSEPRCDAKNESSTLIVSPYSYPP